MSDEKKPDKELEIFGSRILEPTERPSEERPSSSSWGKFSPGEKARVLPGEGFPVAQPSITVEDPSLLGFFRKVYDLAAYATPLISKELLANLEFEPKFFYDTTVFEPSMIEAYFFQIPRGQAMKTEVDTNLDIGGQFTYGNQVFAFATLILRFVSGNGSDCSSIWQNAFLSCEKYNLRMFAFPVSSMAPLYPNSDVRGIFFWMDKTIWQFPNDFLTVKLSIPGGCSILNRVKVRIELYGIMSRIGDIYLSMLPDGRVLPRPRQ